MPELLFVEDGRLLRSRRERRHMEDMFVDPFGLETLQISSDFGKVLGIVLVVSLANSRYLKECCCAWQVLLGLLSILLCVDYASQTFGDLKYCGAGLPKNWTTFTPSWVAVPLYWPGPRKPARDIAEYCSTTPGGETSAINATGMLELSGPMESVMNMWAAWMDLATFSLSFASQTTIREYCRKLDEPVLACVDWLNDTSIGNAITCKNSRDEGSSGLSPELAMEMQEVLAAHNDEDAAHRLMHLSSSYERLALDELAAAGCEASINGANFALHHFDFRPDATAYHVLSLATRGLRCPVDYAPDGKGPAQAGITENCTYNKELLGVDNSTGLLVPHAGMEPFLREPYISCAVKKVNECAQRHVGLPRTKFRSFCQAICAALMLLGVFVMVSASVFGGKCWDTPQEEEEEEEAEEPTSTTISWRQCLGSRVFLGYSISFFLQAGFTLALLCVFLPRLFELENKKHGDHLLPLLVRELPASMIMQFFIVMVMIVVNVRKYVKLRRVILELPAEVFFGDEPPPANYHGPDLMDLKHNGGSSILYAVYFPGIVFWRFFFASWILVVIIMLPHYLLIVAIHHPPELDEEVTTYIWSTICSMIFAGAVLFSHFVTRLFVQRCLFSEDETGVDFRCLCLFSWWEVMTILLALALGPFTALYDFLKTVLSTVLSALIVDKPNFTQFGELSDYVYCAYCASLYLERIQWDVRTGNDRVYDEDCIVEMIPLDDYDVDFERCSKDADEEEGAGKTGEFLRLEEPSYRFRCPARFLIFVLVFCGIPCVFDVLLSMWSDQLGYPCSELVWFAKGTYCSEAARGNHMGLVSLLREHIDDISEKQQELGSG